MRRGKAPPDEDWVEARDSWCERRAFRDPGLGTRDPRPAGAAEAPGTRRGLRMRAGRGGDADTTASSALSPCCVTAALRPSFPRRPRDHGRSSREADQDQNRRGEAVRSRERRSRQRLLSLASWRPERPGGAQARGGLRTLGLTWGSAADGDRAGTERARGFPPLRAGTCPSPCLSPQQPNR